MLPYSEQGKFNSLSPEPDRSTELDYFFSHAYHDMRFFLEVTTQASSVVYTYFGDLQRNLFYISDNLRDTFGFSNNVVEDLPGKWREHIFGEKWKQLYNRDRQNILKTKSDTHDLRYQVVDKDGKISWIHCYGRVQWNPEKTSPIFIAGRLIKQDDFFSVDSLTNFLTEQTLHRRLDTLRKHNYYCVTIGFSLNHIAEINTKFGRSLGDRLIENISNALTENFCGRMSFYCLPGFRYMALVDNEVKDSCSKLVSDIRKVIEESYRQMDLSVDRPCSFAVVNFSQHDNDSKNFVENMTSLVKLSEQDYTADFLVNSQENMDKIRRQANLKIAIAKDVFNGMQNFKAFIQPIVSAKTGRITAGETLMRWEYNGSDVSPGVFIPILERDRMIHIAGRWILEQAVQACATIVKYIPDFSLSVNVSLHQLTDHMLTDHLSELLERYHLDGHHLIIEITESSMIQHPEKLQALIDNCNKRGVQVALDDFGTGYSSLQTFLSYRTNIVKIDRSLLLEISKSSCRTNFMGSIISACHQLGQAVCIEGVETEEQKALSLLAGCDYIQGFYFYRPSALNVVYDIVKHQAQTANTC